MERKLSMVIPKGRIFDNVISLLREAGVDIRPNARHYVPYVGNPDIQAKIMKPQNIPQLIELGSHDVGFTGYDWIVESGAKVVELIDLGLDPVTIVAAIPTDSDLSFLRGRKIIVASEYQQISTNFLQREGFDFVLIRTYGASEAFPPQDADMIIDNRSTGQTLREHNLKAIAEIMTSSTRFIANPRALEDEWKKEKIDSWAMLFKAVLNARKRVMLEMNVPSEKLEAVVKFLPCMRAPTVAPLFGDQGYAVKVAVPREDVAQLIPKLKWLGATDILEYSLRKVIT